MNSQCVFREQKRVLTLCQTMFSEALCVWKYPVIIVVLFCRHGEVGELISGELRGGWCQVGALLGLVRTPLLLWGSPALPDSCTHPD